MSEKAIGDTGDFDRIRAMFRVHTLLIEQKAEGASRSHEIILKIQYRAFEPTIKRHVVSATQAFTADHNEWPLEARSTSNTHFNHHFQEEAFA